MTDKYRFIETIMKILMLPDVTHIAKIIDSLVDRNNQLCGVANNGFTLGKTYFQKGGKITEMLVWEPDCHPTLMKEASQVRYHWIKMEDDRKYLTFVLRELLASCASEQEVRDALPDCLVQFIPSLNCLPRNREAGYTLNADAPVTLQSAMDRFHTYAAMHMMI